MDEGWRNKAHRIIAEHSANAYKVANYGKNGKKYKKHRDFTISDTASALIECLNADDEISAKGIFQRMAMGLPGVIYDTRFSSYGQD